MTRRMQAAPDGRADAEPKTVTVPKATERHWMDAPEPGTYRDEETGTLYRRRAGRQRRAWWRDAPPVVRLDRGD